MLNKLEKCTITDKKVLKYFVNIRFNCILLVLCVFLVKSYVKM